MGSLEQSLPILSLSGSIEANGGSFNGVASHATIGGPGGGSGGTILLFVRTLLLKKDSVLSSVGGIGSNGSGGGGGGRIHFHWSDIPTGDDYVPFATVKGTIITRCVLIRMLSVSLSSFILLVLNYVESLVFYALYLHDCLVLVLIILQHFVLPRIGDWEGTRRQNFYSF